MGIAGNPRESPGSCQGAGVQEFVGVLANWRCHTIFVNFFLKNFQKSVAMHDRNCQPPWGGEVTFLDFFFLKISLLSVAPSTFLVGMGDVVESCKLLSQAMEDTNPVWLARTW